MVAENSAEVSMGFKKSLHGWAAAIQEIGKSRTMGDFLYNLTGSGIAGDFGSVRFAI